MEKKKTTKKLFWIDKTMEKQKALMQVVKSPV